VRQSGHEVHMPLPRVSTKQKVWKLCLHAVVVTSDAGPRASKQIAHSSAGEGSEDHEDVKAMAEIRVRKQRNTLTQSSQQRLV